MRDFIPDEGKILQQIRKRVCAGPLGSDINSSIVSGTNRGSQTRDFCVNSFYFYQFCKINYANWRYTRKFQKY